MSGYFLLSFEINRFSRLRTDFAVLIHIAVSVPLCQDNISIFLILSKLIKFRAKELLNV